MFEELWPLRPGMSWHWHLYTWDNTQHMTEPISANITSQCLSVSEDIIQICDQQWQEKIQIRANISVMWCKQAVMINEILMSIKHFKCMFSYHTALIMLMLVPGVLVDHHMLMMFLAAAHSRSGFSDSLPNIMRNYFFIIFYQYWGPLSLSSLDMLCLPLSIMLRMRIFGNKSENKIADFLVSIFMLLSVVPLT